jgi:transcriptional regulator with XRE-family HTH domain
MRPAVRARPLTVKSAETVGIAISIQRRSLKLTQQAVADAAGVERAVVGRLERARDDTALFRVVLAVVNALDMDVELRSRHWTPEGPYSVDPKTSVVELGLTLDTLDRLKAAGIHEVGQLGSASDLLRLPEFSKGTELYELVCLLSHRGLSLPISSRQRPVSDREREMFRLRVIEGLSLQAIGERVGIQSERVRQILNSHFGLTGTPPATKAHKRATTAKRRAENLAAAQTHQAELIAAWRTGKEPRDLAEKFSLSSTSVEEVIATTATPDDRAARAKVRGGRRGRRDRWPTR